MSELNEQELRRALREIAGSLEDARLRAVADAKQTERSPHLAAFYEGMEVQARVSLAILHGWTRGEFGAMYTDAAGGDSAVTS